MRRRLGQRDKSLRFENLWSELETECAQFAKNT